MGLYAYAKFLLPRIAACLVIAATILWICIDADIQNRADYGSIPSFFGPGSYLAFVITWLDYLSTQWTGVIKWLLNLPRLQDQSYEKQSKELRSLQRLTIGGYIVSSYIWIMYIVWSEKSKAQQVAAVETIGSLIRTAYLLLLPSIAITQYSWLPIVLCFPGFSGRMYLVDEPTKVAKYLYLLAPLLFIATIAAPFYNLFRPAATQPQRLNESKFMITVIASHMAFYVLYESLYQSVVGRSPLRLRAPWPKSECSFWDMDQVFAVALAVASVIVLRRDRILATLKQCIQNQVDSGS
jgi:hypothetical protein